MEKSTLIDARNKKSGSGEKPPESDEVESMALYAARKQIYPKLAYGKFRLVKWIILFASLAVYYGLPWIRWDRGPGASNQAVHADFEGERFYFFFIEIWPQEAYYITGLLILAALVLFVVTALFGRVWCGYACPQTVWTDLFIAVERMFEGDRNARIMLDRAPWSFNKAWRKIGKHLVWVYISFITGGAWILYWHDAPTLARTFFVGEAPTSAYVFAALLTGTTYALAGTMREQVCTYLCPWPRIQSALIDQDTLAVTYRADRGEPRGAHKKGTTWEDRGDCIDCNQCVAVCPQGIDIRDGLQLECIHCALCIDACDAIMKKVDRPTGLIAYDTDENVERRANGLKAVAFKLFRARTVLYVCIILGIAALMTFGLSTRSNLDLNVLKDRSVPYVALANGDIRNGYTLKLINKLHERRDMLIGVEGVDGARLQVVGEGQGTTGVRVVSEADGVDRFRILITSARNQLDQDGSTNISITVRDAQTGEMVENTVPFISPSR